MLDRYGKERRTVENQIERRSKQEPNFKPRAIRPDEKLDDPVEEAARRLHEARKRLGEKQNGFFRTEKEASEIAKGLGWKRTKKQSHGAEIYFDPQAKRYFTKDQDGHKNGSGWKCAKRIQKFEMNDRDGTYSILGKRWLGE